MIHTLFKQETKQIDVAHQWADVCADDNTYKDEGSDLKIMRLLDNLNLEAQKMGGAVISILGTMN